MTIWNCTTNHVIGIMDDANNLELCCAPLPSRLCFSDIQVIGDTRLGAIGVHLEEELHQGIWSYYINFHILVST